MKDDPILTSNDKTLLRERCLDIRSKMAPEKVLESSRAVCDHLDAWPLFQQARTPLSFLAFRNEIDLAPLFERWPDKHWLVPRISKGAQSKPYLVLHTYSATDLIRHKFGMLEPDPALPMIAPQEVDLALVPGVAFDKRGGRLGYGGGFYDRLLPTMTHAISVGVTFDELVLDQVPMRPWDVYVDWLVTPQNLWVLEAEN
jgi:5-formyltetrahydrofolate cyclo-ligase